MISSLVVTRAPCAWTITGEDEAECDRAHSAWSTSYQSAPNDLRLDLAEEMEAAANLRHFLYVSNAPYTAVYAMGSHRRWVPRIRACPLASSPAAVN